MKVSVCEGCAHHIRKTWSHVYSPANYHNIGYTHAYGYCSINNDRCSSVRKEKCAFKKIQNKGFME